MARVLVVDDELSMREFMSILLEREGYEVVQADAAESALTLLNEQYFDVVLSDVSMPGLSGLELLARIKEATPDTVVLLITAYSTAERAVEAMKLGAYDYIAKPFKVEEIKVLVQKALDQRNLQVENKRLHHELEKKYGFGELIGKSQQMKQLFSLIEKVAQSTATVLISGESGTGKELVAKAIHYNSPRRRKSFVAVNCGAIPDTLIESELFGHMKGSFTGAIADRQGLFEQADGGTLFLDEIGEIPIQLQAKMLRALQEREVRRLGGQDNLKFDARIIAATNRDLGIAVKEGRFREDLYYRLNVIELFIPPLRERSEDIPLLIRHFVEKISGQKPQGEVIAADALPVLLGYQYPGNVRELVNVVERCLTFGQQTITKELLPRNLLDACVKEQPGLHGATASILPASGIDLESYLMNLERSFLEQALSLADGRKGRAAALLGLSFRSFRYRLSKFGMDDVTLTDSDG